MKLFLFLLLLLGQAEALFKSRVAAPKVPAYKAAVSSSRFPRGKVVARSAQVIEEPFGQVAQAATDLTITALRLGTCALMAHHGLDKIQHVDGFTANVVVKFFGFLPGEPSFWTLAAAATQLVGAGLLGIGLLSRPTAAAMSGTMITAVAFHLLNTGPEGFPLAVPTAHSYNFELAAMYVITLFYFTAAGAGRYSVDEQVLGGELAFYQRLLDKVKGGEE